MGGIVIDPTGSVLRKDGSAVRLCVVHVYCLYLAILDMCVLSIFAMKYLIVYI